MKYSLKCEILREYNASVGSIYPYTRLPFGGGYVTHSLITKKSSHEQEENVQNPTAHEERYVYTYILYTW